MMSFFKWPLFDAYNIYINIKCLSLITELFTIETKVKKGCKAAGVIFCAVDHIARNPFWEEVEPHCPVE